MNNKIYIVFMAYLIILLILPQGYNKYIPSIPIYPNNEEEVKLVEYYISQRNLKDISFFTLTNINLPDPFIKILPQESEYIKKLVNEPKPIIYFFKYIINRERPKNIVRNLDILDSKGTADTPAYPAGHALQAYYIAKKLSQKYPEKKNILNKIAEMCDLCRVKAGLHFPSDGQYSKYLVDNLL